MHFIISNELYYTIEKIVFLNRTLGTIFLITVPLVSISLCINLSLYNKGEKKKVPIMFKIYYLIIFLIISIHVLYNINLKHTQTVLPEGELLNTYYSPDKKSMIKVYNLTYAVLDRLYRGCRIDSIDRTTWEIRRIYFNPEDTRPKIKWINNDNVIINGNKINIKDGYYNDYNNGK